MESEAPSGRQAAFTIIVNSAFQGIGLAIGAAIVAIFFRLLGFRWNPA